MPISRSNNKIYSLFQSLYKKHGDPAKLWPQWCARKKTERLREIIAIGAILTQRTSWFNAEKALVNLKKSRLLSLSKISSLKNSDGIVPLVKPAGFYTTKPKRLLALADFFTKNYKGIKEFRKIDLVKSRLELLDVYGVGPETADTILLYALDRPSFVIDEYTKRFVTSRVLKVELKYDNMKKYFQDHLPQDVRIYQDFHALIIIDQVGRTGSMMGVV